MNSIITSLFLFVAAADEKKDSPTPTPPPIPVGKDTTYVTGPVDKDGFINYEAAINQLLGKGVTAEKNCMALLMKALGPKPEGGNMPEEYYKLLGITEPPEKGDYLVSLGTYIARVNLVPMQREELFEHQQRASARPWRAVDMPHITAWLDLNEKPLAVVLEAVKRSRYFNPLVSRPPAKGRTLLIGALLPTVQKCRELASLLTARAMQRVGEGKAGEAWQDLLACHRLARHVAHGGTLIESLVGIAIDAIASNADIAYLATANLNVKQMHACMKDLRDLPPMPNMADKVATMERFMFLDCVQNLRDGGFNFLRGLALDDLPEPKDKDKAAKDLMLIDWSATMRSGNRFYDRVAEAMRRKERGERELAFDAIEQHVKDLRKDSAKAIELLEKGPPDEKVGKAIGDALIGMVTPAVRKVQNASDRGEQIHRNLQVAFALALYHKENGKYPSKLNDLEPKYLAAVPGDIFSGKPLVYKPADKGYLFYSVGVNGKDDDGRWYDDDPPGDDPRVRMPLPEWNVRR